MKQACNDFIRHLEAGEYFLAHEVLERLWFPIRHSEHTEKNILRGLINASVSFELIRRNRPAAARRVWKTYRKYLPLLKAYRGENRSHYDAAALAVETIHKKFEDIYG